MKRRNFLHSSWLALGAAFSQQGLRGDVAPLLGQGDFRYRVVPGWGVLDAKTPVKNCHGIVTDRQGNIILLTDHVSNNILIYDKAGRLLHKWGTSFPGAHGLSLVREGEREVLFITDLQRHKVYKTSIEGALFQQWEWPVDSGKYQREDQYKPSWTLHLHNGDFFVLDGYGRDFITRYDATGKFVKSFGGAEGGIVHWGPHGGMTDVRDPVNPSLLIAMSDQQHILRLSLEGETQGKIEMPGGNPRQIRSHKNHFFVAHLADNWPANKNSRGFISVLDSELKVVSNIGGAAPVYGVDGKLQRMSSLGEVFVHPHDITVDAEGSIYVAQFASGNTYPIKLERV